MKRIILTIVAIYFFSSCNYQKKQEKEISSINTNIITLTEAQCKNAQIELGKLETKIISTRLKLNGKIDVPPQNIVSVSMPLGGFLKSTKLLPGMPVKKGETIASMEDQQYIQLQQEYLIAKSKLTFAEQEFNRQRDLNQSKASSDKVFQQSELDFKNQKIILSALAEKLRLINIKPETLNELNLSRCINIYSSIDGFVSKVDVNIGKYLNPSDVLFELINPDDIHLNLKVFEQDLNKLAIGQKILAFNNNNPQKKHRCEIILISRDLSADRTGEVHCHFDDYDKSLLPGMYMNAEVEINSVNAFIIIDDAIVNFEEKNYVFISKGKNQFEMVEIIKGSSENNYTEINYVDNKTISNSTFVLKGAYSLLMQLKNKSE